MEGGSVRPSSSDANSPLGEECPFAQVPLRYCATKELCCKPSKISCRFVANLAKKLTLDCRSVIRAESAPHCKYVVYRTHSLRTGFKTAFQ